MTKLRHYNIIMRLLRCHNYDIKIWNWEVNWKSWNYDTPQHNHEIKVWNWDKDHNYDFKNWNCGMSIEKV